MKYPKPLNIGDTIGICAPSSGVYGYFEKRLDNAIKQLKDLGYNLIETESVRNNKKLVSASREKRASEFMSLYLNEEVKAIIPPWGGEFLMEILPYLDYEKISNAAPKWIVGFSDTSTLLFTLTIKCDIATVNGPNLLDFGAIEIDDSVLNLLNILKTTHFEQTNLELFQKEWPDSSKNYYVPYNLTEKVVYKIIYNKDECEFSGRLIGGCLDVICKLFETPYALVNTFLDKYKNDNFIWLLESVEMNSTDICRTLWQMKVNGYFKYCTGILIGRVEGYSDVKDFNYLDALKNTLHELNIPIIYDIDFGHLPPQLTFINGAKSSVFYKNESFKIVQELS